MNRMLRRLAGVLVLVVLWLASASALAHGLYPGVLRLTEEQPGVFTVAWTEPVDTSGASTPIELEFPAHCRRDAVRLDCGAEGLQGTIQFRGLETGRVSVMALVEFLDGRTLEVMLDAKSPALQVDRAPGRSPVAWLRLGVEHVLGGLDHLAFVLGLLLVVGTSGVRRLAATITAFTVAHSLTLALAATGTLVLPSAPVEASIAASVVLVAREATHDRPTLTRRAPWAVALVFGLVHGLGFAGALASWGLPAGWVGWSLLWFNLGIEAGQLAVVLVVVVIARVASRVSKRRAHDEPRSEVDDVDPRNRANRAAPRKRSMPRLVAAYAIGGLGAWWLVERTLGIVTAGS